MKRVVTLIDGEHYIPITKWAIDNLVKEKQYDIVGAVFIGGTEKIGKKGDLDALNLPIIMKEDALEGIKEGINKFKPDIIVDLSDEPIVGYRERFKFANLILSHQVVYTGADFRFEPPRYLDIMTKPSIAVVGTGKRIGKTAACAHMARILSGQEGKETLFDPVIVTMGRGGPPEPELVRGKELNMTPECLVSLANKGKHAASDHFEDAYITHLTTIGSRRCGGGFAGVTFFSNVEDSAALANTLPEDFVLFEGSGASTPSVKTDARILIIGAHQPLDYIGGYMGPYRVMMSDLIIITMCEPPMADKEKVQKMDSFIREINPKAKVIHTIFRPRPLESIEGKKILLTVTAPSIMNDVLSNHLEENYGCQVIGVSNHLSNRPKLREDMKQYFDKGEVDTILTEIKAAGIDVAARLGLEHDLKVVFMDNILTTVGGDGDLNELVIRTAKKAVKNFKSKK